MTHAGSGVVQYIDPEVRTNEACDNFVKQMQKILNKVSIECDKALSRTMRTSTQLGMKYGERSKRKSPWHPSASKT